MTGRRLTGLWKNSRLHTSKQYKYKGNRARKDIRSANTAGLQVYCRSAMERLEFIMRKAGIIVSFQWPKESMGFVKGIRDKVEGMGFERRTHLTRIRPSLIAGMCSSGLMWRRQKEKTLWLLLTGGFRPKWENISNIMETEWETGGKEILWNFSTSGGIQEPERNLWEVSGMCWLN